MNVITESEHRRLALRKPTLPVIYEEAVRDLIACQSLDEAKYFADKAEALAAYSVIYRDDKAGIEAKRLKLHAYRRMGQLAAELRPHAFLGNGGSAPGPGSLLIESGLNKSQAADARRMAKLDEKRFRSLVDLPRPPAPHTVTKYLVSGSQAWKDFRCAHGPRAAHTWMKTHSASEIAMQLTADEAVLARRIIVEMQEWIDEFERFLTK